MKSRMGLSVEYHEKSYSLLAELSSDALVEFTHNSLIEL